MEMAIRKQRKDKNMGKLVEGVWDCTHCGSKAIKARYKKCPGCGASQDEDTVFRLPNQITYVPEEEAKNISRNPDWQHRNQYVRSIKQH